MYTESVISQIHGNIYGSKYYKLKNANTFSFTSSKHVLSDSSKDHASSDTYDKNEEYNTYLNKISLVIHEKLVHLFSNPSFKPILKDSELVDVESFKNFIKNTNISCEKRTVLELCLLILIFLKNNENNYKNDSHTHNNSDSPSKFDLCSEIVNKITNGNYLFYKNYKDELDLLVNICIWTVELSNASNLAQLCYELLVQALRCGFKSELLVSYIRNSILSKSAIISHISYTEAHYRHIYWSLRMLQLSVSKNILDHSDFKSVREFGLNAIKLRNKSLYILDEAACLLAQIWLVEGVDFNLEVENRLRILAKLLSIGDSSFLINFRLDELTKIALLGPVESRKLSLKCLFLLPEKVENYIIIKNIEKILYANNFKRFKLFLNRIDLGILAVGVRYLRDLNSSLVYLSSLHILINNIILTRAGSNNCVTNDGSLSAIRAKLDPSKFDYLALLKALYNRPVGACNQRCIIHRLNSIRNNLKQYYYPLFDLINAIIATKSSISTANSMAIKVDYVPDLSLYLLLGIDANFTSIRRDYIKALTISTNHIDFGYITQLMDLIGEISASNGRIGGKYRKMVFKTLVCGLLEYLDVLFQFSVVDIYGSHHPRINQFCEEIIGLFKAVIGVRSVRGDLRILAQMLTVLRGVYGYNRLVLDNLVETLLLVVPILGRHCFNMGSESSHNSQSVRFREHTDGFRDELLTSFCALYELLSCEKLPFTVHEHANLAMAYQSSAGPAARGLWNTLRLHSSRQLLQLVAFQLILLQVHDWDPPVLSQLRRLVNLVLVKLGRSACRLVRAGELHTYRFESHNFRLTQDSIKRKLKELLDVHLVALFPVNELRLFDSAYALAPDVVQRFPHDCPGE